VLHGVGGDFTRFFIALAETTAGDDTPVTGVIGDSVWLRTWLTKFHERSQRDGRSPGEQRAAMLGANPRYVPRNHLVEAALTAATGGDLAPLHRLVDILRSPFTHRSGAADYELPDPDGGQGFRTFCGT
jgi:serine/tyrosine/threonine adenylyltransferase